jgi:hypothetical protein
MIARARGCCPCVNADDQVAPSDGDDCVTACDEGLATLKSSGYALSGGGTGCGSIHECTTDLYAGRALDEGLATLKSSGFAHWGGGMNQVHSEVSSA